MIQRRRDHLILLVGDLFVFSISLWLTLLVRSFSVPAFDEIFQHFYPFSILFCVWIAVFLLSGMYDSIVYLYQVGFAEKIIYIQSINIIIAVMFFFFVPYFGITPKTILMIYLFISSSLIVLWRMHVFPRISIYKVNAILIGNGPVAEDLVEFSDSLPHQFSFKYVIDPMKDEKRLEAEKVANILATATENYVIVADIDNENIANILPALYEIAFKYNNFHLIDMYELYENIFERLPLTKVRHEQILAGLGRPVLYDLLKRAMDIVVAMIGCVVLAALYPIIALAIWWDDSGPVLFSQERDGCYGRKFVLLKFRSMTHIGNQTGKESVTSVGRILRPLHLDEMPQFWNVLKGEMSIVGPRPEIPSLVEQYEKTIPFYQARHLVKPGMTGWARIRHKSEPHHTLSVQETKNKLAYDLYYLLHRSFFLDIHIIIQTIRFVITARGS